MKEVLQLIVNGESQSCAVEPGRTLLEALRYDLGLTGSKQGCDKGDCGACTVLVDGEPTLACITLALAVSGQRITTVEGLARGPELHPVQDAFDQLGAAQCGFCTPGMLVSAWACLEQNPAATVEDLKLALSGNLCRCTGYTKILEACLKAGERLQAERAKAAAR
jgi:aerobic-type carbon monoxide dehydrogenase small subunit (CoxS/CutS family)